MSRTLTASDRSALIRLARADRVARRWRMARWYPPKYDSYEEWREVWNQRIQDGVDNPRWDTIARGIRAEVSIPRDFALKVKAGKATARDLLPFVTPGGVGRWWFILDDPLSGDISEAEDFAESYDMGLDSNDLDWDEDPMGLDLSIVLIAERPADWHPDDFHLNQHELWGNSYINEHWKSVPLKAVRYWTGGDNWVTVPASGSVRL